jgi:ATP-dependent DNA helicase RecG
LIAKPGAHAGEHAGAHADEHGETQDMTAKILEFCREPKTRSEIQEFLDIKSRSYFSQKVLSPLVKGGLLKLIIPDKPKSPNQKYYSDR